MSSSTGITLTSNVPAGQVAAVSGGTLNLTVTTGNVSSHGAGFTDPPWASVPLTDSEGRYAARGRVRAHLVTDVGPSDVFQAKFILANDLGTESVVFKVLKWDAGPLNGHTTVECGLDAAGALALTGAFPAALDTGVLTTGTLWLEYEWSDQWLVMRYGYGADATTPPTTWTERARVGLTIGGLPVKWATVRFAFDCPAPAPSDLTRSWDDVTVTRGSP